MAVTVEIPKERWTGTIREVTLGATADEGGTRTKTVTVGGETTLPFLYFEGDMPNLPVIGIEIQNGYPTDWSSVLLDAWGDALHDTAAWAKKAEELGADLLVLSLRGADGDGNPTTGEQAAATVKAVLGATGSVGTTTLEVIRQSQGRLGVGALAARRPRREFMELVMEFSPELVSAGTPAAASQLARLCKKAGLKKLPEFVSGDEGLCLAASLPGARPKG